MAFHQKDELNGGGVVGTVMTNRGLELCLRMRLALHRTNVKRYFGNDALTG